MVIGRGAEARGEGGPTSEADRCALEIKLSLSLNCLQELLFDPSGQESVLGGRARAEGQGRQGQVGQPAVGHRASKDSRNRSRRHYREKAG